MFVYQMQRKRLVTSNLWGVFLAYDLNRSWTFWGDCFLSESWIKRLIPLSHLYVNDEACRTIYHISLSPVTPPKYNRIFVGMSPSYNRDFNWNFLHLTTPLNIVCVYNVDIIWQQRAVGSQPSISRKSNGPKMSRVVQWDYNFICRYPGYLVSPKTYCQRHACNWGVGDGVKINASFAQWETFWVAEGT